MNTVGGRLNGDASFVYESIVLCLMGLFFSDFAKSDFNKQTQPVFQVGLVTPPCWFRLLLVLKLGFNGNKKNISNV